MHLGDSSNFEMRQNARIFFPSKSVWRKSSGCGGPPEGVAGLENDGWQRRDRTSAMGVFFTREAGLSIVLFGMKTGQPSPTYRPLILVILLTEGSRDWRTRMERRGDNLFGKIFIPLVFVPLDTGKTGWGNLLGKSCPVWHLQTPPTPEWKNYPEIIDEYKNPKVCNCFCMTFFWKGIWYFGVEIIVIPEKWDSAFLETLVHYSQISARKPQKLVSFQLYVLFVKKIKKCSIS